MRAIAWRQFCARHGVTKPDAQAWVQENWGDIIQWDKREQAVPVVKMIAYLRKQAVIRERDLERCCNRAYIRPEISVIEYRDYLHQCARLNLDMQDPDVLYPREMHRAHQQNTELLDAQRTAAQRKADKERKEELARKERAFAKSLPKLRKMYEWAQGALLIRVAESEQDLAAEGRFLSHCVGGITYADKHLGRRSMILFVRRADRPDRPFFTVEYNETNGTVVQCRGKKNCAPPDEVKDFLDDWKKEITSAARRKRGGQHNNNETREAA